MHSGIAAGTLQPRIYSHKVIAETEHEILLIPKRSIPLTPSAPPGGRDHLFLRPAAWMGEPRFAGKLWRPGAIAGSARAFVSDLWGRNGPQQALGSCIEPPAAPMWGQLPGAHSILKLAVIRTAYFRVFVNETG